MLSRSILLVNSQRAALLQSRRFVKQMVLTFGGANEMYYFNSKVYQIDVPTFSGHFGILAEHVPTIAVLIPGLVRVYETERKPNDFFVSSGTVSVLADSTVQVLAEEAWELKDLDFEDCKDLVSKYQSAVRRAVTDLERIQAEIALRCATEMYGALTSFGRK